MLRQSYSTLAELQFKFKRDKLSQCWDSEADRELEFAEITTMGLLASLLGAGTGRTDDPNPVTGLTSRDVHLIQSTWGNVRKEPTKNGVAILSGFLKKHPEYMTLFPFKDVPFDDLPSNKRFQAHCNSVIYAFNAMVDNLNDPEVLANLALKIGENHNRLNIPKKAFSKLEVVILEILSSIVSHEALESWKKVLKLARTFFEKPYK